MRDTNQILCGFLNMVGIGGLPATSLNRAQPYSNVYKGFLYQMATSKLQRKVGDMLDSAFPQFRIRENFRPDWLISSDDTWLELDFYIENPKIAFEVQGAQHYQFVPFFHKDEDAFKKRRRHDAEKRDLCRGRRVKFYEICTETDAIIAIKDIQERHCKPPKYFYQESEEWYKVTRSKKMKEKKMKTITLPKPKKVKTKSASLPGSHRMRNYARHTLKVKEHDGNDWRIFGGSKEHLVMEKPYGYKCDCRSYTYNGICSHIIKVQMELGIFPEPE